MLRLLHTSDLHGQAIGYDYHGDIPCEGRGLSRVATYVREARQMHGVCLLFDSGDFLQGTPLSDGPDSLADGEHPMIAAMNIVGYDAATIGNHDLDFGLEHLAAALKCARFPIVSANLELPGSLFPMLRRYAILERETGDGAQVLRLGVTGCLPKDTLSGATLRDDRITAKPVAAALRDAIGEMKREGADLIVVLAHCGRGGVKGHLETIDNSIAPLQGIDAILGGHTHEVYPPQPDAASLVPLGTVPVTLAGAWGQHLARIDLPLVKRSTVWSQAEGATIKIQNMQHGQEAPELLSHLRGAHERTRARANQKLGHTSAPIDSYFALAENNLGLQLVAQAFEKKIEDALAQRGATERLPVLAMTAPYKTGQRAGARHFLRIAQGPIKERDIDALYGFHDTLCALRVTGAELKRILEMSASIFMQVREGDRDVPLLDPRFPGYRFDVIPKLSYEIDLSRPALFDIHRQLRPDRRGRIKALSYQGQAIAPEDVFILAANSHRAMLNTAFGGIVGAELLFDTHESCSDILARYISQTPDLGRAPEPSWRFSSISGASAVFESAPAAEGAQDGRIERLGLTEAGFSLMRVYFD